MEGDIQGKEGECGGWIPRDEPLRFNAPPPPSRSPSKAEEETSHSANRGTKRQIKRRPRKRSSGVIQEQVKKDKSTNQIELKVS